MLPIYDRFYHLLWRNKSSSTYVNKSNNCSLFQNPIIQCLSFFTLLQYEIKQFSFLLKFCNSIENVNYYRRVWVWLSILGWYKWFWEGLHPAAHVRWCGQAIHMPTGIGSPMVSKLKIKSSNAFILSCVCVYRYV